MYSIIIYDCILNILDYILLWYTNFFRKLRLSNTRFQNDVWRHEGGQLVLLEAGWTIDGDFIILPADADVMPMLAILIENRWVEPWIRLYNSL